MSHALVPVLVLALALVPGSVPTQLASEPGPTSAELLARAEDATTRAGFWGAVSLLANLCAEAPPDEAREVRALALALLVREESDTLRWSALLTKRFLPDFASLPRDEWAAELGAYDELLDALRVTSNSTRVRAELLHAKGHARVFINRRWDWLDEQQLRAALALERDLEARFGAQAVPGGGDPQRDTVGRRARQHAGELTRLQFRAPAPATAGVDLDGQALDIADHRGQVVVLDFWSTFCQPCLALVPHVNELLARLAGEDLVYLGVNGDTERAAGRATAQRVGMRWRNLWDGPRGTAGPAAEAWGVGALGWPTVYVLDRAGRIRFKLSGRERIERELEGALRALLAEAPPGQSRPPAPPGAPPASSPPHGESDADLGD